MFQARRRTQWRNDRALVLDQEIADVWPVWEEHHLRTGDLHALLTAVDVRTAFWSRVWTVRSRRVHRHHALADLGAQQRTFDGMYNELLGG